MPNRQELSNADIQRLQGKVIDDYCDKYYNNTDCCDFGGLCSLCGNSGVIDTRETANSGAGIKAGRLNYCICLNGRAMREAKTKLMDEKERLIWLKEHIAKMKGEHGLS